MKLIRTALLHLLLLMMAGPALQAQTVLPEKYKTEADAMRKAVWAWTKPAFEVRTVAAGMSQYSKVIIARHLQLHMETQRAGLSLIVTQSRGQKSAAVYRELLRLNDQRAVEEYSELSFTALTRVSGFLYKKNVSTYIGIRIIKPNGTTTEYNGDDMVLTEKTGSDRKAKIAIPDLAPGDLLDYFVAINQEETTGFEDQPFHLYLSEDAPILSASMEAVLGKRFAAVYRSYNGAPQLSQSKTEDGETMLTMEAKNLPAYAHQLWVAPERQLPFIKLLIAIGSNGIGLASTAGLGARVPGTVLKDPAPMEAVTKLAQLYSRAYIGLSHARDAAMARSEVRTSMVYTADRFGTKWKRMSPDEQADFAYYYLRFRRLQDHSISRERIAGYATQDYNRNGIDLYMLLREADMKASVLIGTPVDGVKPDEVLEVSDFEGMARLPELNRNLMYSSAFAPVNTLKPSMEGVEQSYEITFKGSGMDPNPINPTRFAVPGPGPNPALPRVSTAADNQRIETLTMSLNADGKLGVNRSTTLRGYTKAKTQAALITLEEYVQSERTFYKEERGYVEELARQGKKMRLLSEEIATIYAEMRKRQETAFETEAGNFFNTAVTDMSNRKITSLGTRHTAPDFVYSSSFQLNELVKKAGSNLVVEIGRLTGKPLGLDQEQRSRGSLDVYKPFAESLEYAVTFEVPEGYSASGVEALNKSVVNKAGEFTTKAAMSGRTITLNIKKQYNHRFEPAANWSDLLAIIDASNEFSNAKLLVKKS